MASFPPRPDKPGLDRKPVDPGKPGPKPFDEAPPAGPPPPPPPPPPSNDEPGG